MRNLEVRWSKDYRLVMTGSSGRLCGRDSNKIGQVVSKIADAWNCQAVTSTNVSPRRSLIATDPFQNLRSVRAPNCTALDALCSVWIFRVSLLGIFWAMCFPPLILGHVLYYKHKGPTRFASFCFGEFRNRPPAIGADSWPRAWRPFKGVAKANGERHRRSPHEAFSQTACEVSAREVPYK